MSNFLDKDGLQRFFTGLKNVFAPKSHTHSASDIASSDTADQGKFLRADGTWQTVSGGGTAYEHPTYTAYTGRPTANHDNVGPGDTFYVSQIKTNTLGHVTSLTHRSIRLSNVATLIWENASPTSSFAAQAISLDASITDYYDALLIVSREFNTSDRHTAEILLIADGDQLLNIQGGLHCFSSTNNRNGMRTVTVETDENNGLMVRFSACQYNDGTNNSYCIPRAIYGLRLYGDGLNY